MSLDPLPASLLTWLDEWGPGLKKRVMAALPQHGLSGALAPNLLCNHWALLLIASIRQQVHCSNSAASLGPLLCCAECRQLCGAASLAPAIQSPFARIKGVIEGKKSLAIHIACVCRKGSRRRGPNYSQLGANWRCIRRFFFLINTLDGSCKPIARAFKDGLLTFKGRRGVRNYFQGSCSNIQGLNHYWYFKLLFALWKCGFPAKPQNPGWTRAARQEWQAFGRSQEWFSRPGACLETWTG